MGHKTKTRHEFGKEIVVRKGMTGLGRRLRKRVEAESKPHVINM